VAPIDASNLQPRGEVAQAPEGTSARPPLTRFLLLLVLFGLAVFFLPRQVRGWFVLIILLGALSYNQGAIQEAGKALGVLK
jgi:hypothetical protein